VAPASEGSRSSASPLIEKRGENGELQYYREIQDIRVGDEVFSWNEKTARIEYRRVTETFVHQTKLIFEISYRNGEKLETTWNHPFYITGRGWVQAKDLRVNDRSLAVKELQEPTLAFASRYVPTAMAAAVLSDDDTGSEIARIRQVHRDDTVNNLEVDETHAYFVGEGGVLVHNYDLATGRVDPEDTFQSIADKINQQQGTHYTAQAIARMDGYTFPSPPMVGEHVMSVALFDSLSDDKKDAFINERRTGAYTLILSAGTEFVGGYGGGIDAGYSVSYDAIRASRGETGR